MSVVEAVVDEDGLEIPEELRSSFAVLRRGIRDSPELRAGLGFTVIISLGVVIAHLTTPVLIQLVFDHG
ncbi:MAG TPA: hypothetical protein VFW51_09075, partial [Actinomycetota bacterium]|nr:hypothetical protein [Actinomycetota bacterium]